MRILSILCFLLLAHHASASPSATMQQKAQALINAYPTELSDFDGTHLVWKDGSRMRFDDGRQNKSFDELLNDPDVEDMFYTSYEFGGGSLQPGLNMDPGRVRNQAFFNKLYGACKAPQPCRKGSRVRCQPKGRIKRIRWLRRLGGKSLNATTHLGVADKLVHISRELEALSKYRKFLVPSAGGYNPRCIAGTNRLSGHSYGMAVDIRYSGKRYWKHAGKRKGEVCTARGLPASGCYLFQNDIPARIVQIFEKYGFIWGGNWYHFDSFHFEYRPEFKELAKLLKKN